MVSYSHRKVLTERKRKTRNMPKSTIMFRSRPETGFPNQSPCIRSTECVRGINWDSFFIKGGKSALGRAAPERNIIGKNTTLATTVAVLVFRKMLARENPTAKKLIQLNVNAKKTPIIFLGNIILNINFPAAKSRTMLRKVIT